MLRFWLRRLLIFMSFRLIFQTYTPQVLHMCSTYFEILSLTSSLLFSSSCRTYTFYQSYILTANASHGEVGHLAHTLHNVLHDVGGFICVDDSVEERGIDIDRDVVLRVYYLVSHVDDSRFQLDCSDAFSQRVVVVQSRLQNFLVFTKLLHEAEIRGGYLLIGTTATSAAVAKTADIFFIGLVPFSHDFLVYNLKLYGYARLLIILSEVAMIKSRDTSPKSTISNRPRSFTLNVEQFSPRATFKTSFPSKKYSEICKHRKESISTLQKPKQKKGAETNKGTLEIDASSLKEILNMKIFKAVFQDRKEEAPKIPKVPFKHKLKYKMIRATQSHRTNPTVTIDTTEQSGKLMSKGSKCLVFQSDLPFTEQQQAALARSSEKCIRTSNGSNKKIDSYMYLRKVKAKGDKRVMTQVRGESALNERTNRQLYIMKQNNSRRKTSYLSSYCGLMMKMKKSKEKRAVTEKQEYRPWSAGRSEISD